MADFNKNSPARMYFSHPAIGTLITEYGVNNTSWDYRLNVQRYPTYGGEVVQILSVLVDDVTLSGQVATYQQMELFFAYFGAYIELATQGHGLDNPVDKYNPISDITKAVGTSGQGQGGVRDYSFNEIPIRLQYPERGWDFYIQPKETVGFRYGREQVAPQWEITAAVYDTNPNLKNDLEKVISSGFQLMDEFGSPQSTADNTFDIVGQIGFNPNNPFSNPFPQEGITGSYDASLTKPILNNFGTYYNNIIKGYAGGDYSILMNQFGSGPMPNSNSKNSSSSTNNPGTKGTKTKKKK